MKIPVLLLNRYEFKDHNSRAWNQCGALLRAGICMISQVVCQVLILKGQEHRKAGRRRLDQWHRLIQRSQEGTQDPDGSRALSKKKTRASVISYDILYLAPAQYLLSYLSSLQGFCFPCHKWFRNRVFPEPLVPRDGITGQEWVQNPSRTSQSPFLRNGCDTVVTHRKRIMSVWDWEH